MSIGDWLLDVSERQFELGLLCQSEGAVCDGPVILIVRQKADGLSARSRQRLEGKCIDEGTNALISLRTGFDVPSVRSNPSSSSTPFQS